MTRETAKREIDSLDYYLQNHTDDYSEESHMAMMMAIDALDSSENLSNVLNKVRAEIEHLTYYWCEVNPKTVIDDVLQIIDKYKAESEDKE